MAADYAMYGKWEGPENGDAASGPQTFQFVPYDGKFLGENSAKFFGDLEASTQNAKAGKPNPQVDYADGKPNRTYANQLIGVQQLITQFDQYDYNAIYAVPLSSKSGILQQKVNIYLNKREEKEAIVKLYQQLEQLAQYPRALGATKPIVDMPRI